METERITSLYRFLRKAVQMLYDHGIRHAVLCPGSRSAPLALTVMRYEGMKYHIIDDERSAGYVALGLAQSLREGVLVITTSGTAALNLAPAMAEAYYQEVPLLAWTADRPLGAIHRVENQAIRQPGIFEPNVKASYTWPNDFFQMPHLRYALSLLNEALYQLLTTPRGSVHLNIPIAEPFYPSPDIPAESDPLPHPPTSTRPPPQLTYSVAYEYAHRLATTARILLLMGHRLPNYPLRKSLKAFSRQLAIPVLADPIANYYSPHHTWFLNDDFWMWLTPNQQEILRPDLLITIGYRFLSKSLRQFFRTHPPSDHWHIGFPPYPIDPFEVLTQTIRVHPQTFLQQIRALIPTLDVSERLNYIQQWQAAYDEFYALRADGMLPISTEAALFLQVIELLPSQGILHLGNSLPVRHFQHIPPHLQRKMGAWDIFANRGTSGIDGSLSTAIGHARSAQRTIFAIIGDQSFFYDANALWTDSLPQNLHIVVINNHGGRIFQTISGPSRQPEFARYFARTHQRSIRGLAEYQGLRYYRASNAEELRSVWPHFAASGPSILEIDIT